MLHFLFIDDKLIDLLTVEEKPSGGAAVQALGWVKGLQDEGHRVSIVTRTSPDQKLKQEFEDLDLIPFYDDNKGIKKIRWATYRLPYFYKIFKEVRPDYVYVGIPSWSTFYFALMCKALGIKLIVRISSDGLVDNRILSKYSKSHKLLQAMGLSLSETILCQNDYQLAQIQKRFPNKKTVKLSNPIFPYTPPVNLGMPKNAIVWLGLFKPEKNLKLLFEIATLMPEQEFVVAGKEEKNINSITRAYVKQLKTLPNVKFIGFLQRHEVLPVLAQAKFLLNTSHYEGFSNTFLEAMYVGTPIISSGRVNPDGIISTHKLGIIYATREDLQLQLESLDTKKYDKMRSHCLDYISAHHNHRLLTQKLLAFLENRPFINVEIQKDGKKEKALPDMAS
ncbi:glycosyltransferase family 4 protein [Litoribacter ruber]|uniref:glycosyltransferase family 4 protein n=1 Tax=Litoribacter ruber TaxID=702568 RepID=UPI001BD9988F|nr:glycosyltransferase family 4 protein [Litoribacter ruber]MBT0810078.1 glycosyltransferase family 4 protein [Litoribacter ruber]